MGVFSQTILFFLLFISIECEEHLYAHGPFRKAHLSVDRPNPYNCNRTIDIFQGFIHRTTLNITELQVSTTNYSNGGEITVTWMPSSQACKDDFIGVYFVETPELTGACKFVDFEFVTTGQNVSRWAMLNLRRQLEFRYYSRANCTKTYQFIAKSAVVQPINANEPVQVHLALGNQPDQVFVSYLTNSSEVIPQCQYGLSPSSLTSQVNGTTTTYRAEDMCEGKANLTGPQNFIDPGYMHTMLISDLRPSTTYYYRVGSNAHGWSPIYHFYNRPTNLNEMLHLLAFGDMGVSPIQPGAKPTIDRVLAMVHFHNASAVLHLGDISYARGTGALWDAFMNQIQPTASTVPYMVGIGNHEYDHLTGGEKDPSHAPGPGGFRPPWGNYGLDSGGECAVPPVHRFHSPSNGNGLFWYSFDIGGAHVVYYSTEHDFLPNSSQYLWLENDLKSVSRSRTPWLIVTGHREMYSSLQALTNSIPSMLKEHLEPLFHKYHVDLHLYGHVHAYQRTCKVYKDKCVSEGTTNVLIGMGGHDLATGSFRHEPWNVYNDIEYGYTHIWLNKTHLGFNYHHTSDDKIVDHFYINK